MPILAQLDILAEPGASPTLAAETIPMQVANTPGGFPEVDYGYIPEPVVSGGVNFTRARVPRSDYPRFQLVGLSGAEDYGAAATFARIFRRMAGRRTGLIFEAGGEEFDFEDYEFYIWKITARPVNGELVVADESFAAYIEISAELQRYV